MTKETSRILPQSLDALWELHNSGMQSLSTPELSSCSTSSDDQSSFSISSPEDHPSPNFDDGSLMKSVYFSSPVSPIHMENSIVHRPRRLSGGDHRYASPRGPAPIGPRAPPNKISLLMPNIHPYISPGSPRHSRQPRKPRPAALPLSDNWDSHGSDTPSIYPYIPMRAPTLPEFPRNSPFGHPSMQTPTTKLTKKKARPLLANITSDAFFPTGDTESVSPQSSGTHSVVGFDFSRKEDQLTSTVGVPDDEHAEGEVKKEVDDFSVKREQHKDWLPSLDFPTPITILSPKHLHFHNLHSSYPNRLVRRSSTEALTSLAWTGEFPASVSSSVYSRPRIGDTFLPTFGIGSPTSRSGWRSTWSLAEEPDDDDDEEEKSNMNLGLTSPIAPISSRHRLIQRDDAMGNKRQWTLAMAITDEDISDERLLGELEKVRTRKELWEWQNNRAFPLPSQRSPLRSVKGQDESPDFPASKDVKHDRRPLGLKPSLPSLSDPALSATWQVARRALLTCRELVRTERHYLWALHALCSNGTQSPPPAMMMTYLPALVLASEGFLARMEANPSAQGVADAFVAEKEQLEAALVGWSGVVGGFFVGAESRTVGRARSTSGVRGRGVKDTNQGSIRRRVGSWKWKKGKHSILSLGESVPAPIPPLEGDKEPTKERGKPTVRDLAILPTQRAMRYILLYKDLFSHTSSASASQVAVGRAMQAAITIAQNCDRAQGNAAFLLQRA